MQKFSDVRTFLVFLMLLVSVVACSSGTVEQPCRYSVYQSEQMRVPNPEEPDKPIAAGIYAPSEDGGTTMGNGPFGLIVLMPGFGARYPLYAAYAESLAACGSIVVGMNFNVPLGFDGKNDVLVRQTLTVIDFALDPAGPLGDRVDGTRIATAGHSQGGKIAFFAAALDHRIRVVMAMDPANGGGPPCFIAPRACNAYPVAPNPETGATGVLDQVRAASLILRAEPCLVNPDAHLNAKLFFYGSDGHGTHAVPPPALYLDLGNAGHVSWLPQVNPEVSGLTQRAMAIWTFAYFNDASADPYVIGEMIRAGPNGQVVKTMDARG